MSRIFLADAHVRMIENHIETKTEPEVKKLWVQFLNDVKTHGFDHSDNQPMRELLGMDGNPAFSGRILLKLMTNMREWLATKTNLTPDLTTTKNPPTPASTMTKNPPTPVLTTTNVAPVMDPKLDFIPKVWGVFIRILVCFVGTCVGKYDSLPPWRVMLRMLWSVLYRLLLASVMLFVVWGVFSLIWSIDITGMAGLMMKAMAWVADCFSRSQASFISGATWCWTSMTTLPILSWNTTLSKWPVWDNYTSCNQTVWVRDLDTKSVVIDLQNRMSLLDKCACVPVNGVVMASTSSDASTSRLENLDSLVSLQRSQHNALGETMKGHVQVYNQEKSALDGKIRNLTGELQVYNQEKSALDSKIRNLTGELQIYNQKRADLEHKVRRQRIVGKAVFRMLMKRVDGLQTQLVDQGRKVARLEVAGIVNFVMSSTTIIVGAGSTVVTMGYMALGKMALGYALTVLCEFGALTSLVEGPIV